MDNTRIAILTPLVMLLKSRKVILAVIKLGLDVLFMLVPSLQPMAVEFLTVSTATYLALVLGISWEDAAKQGREEKMPANIQEAIETTIRETIRQLAQGRTDEYNEPS